MTQPDFNNLPAIEASIATVSDWLMPINEPEPCGPSLEYDPEYAVLLSRMRPRGEAQYGSFIDASQVPNWAEIERDCRRLLLRTRDINLLVLLCRARTRLGQASGLAHGLGLLLASVRAWPDDIHPQLVVDAEPDPDVRANALAALADSEGLLADVRDIAVDPGTATRLTVRDVERAFGLPRHADAPSPESVQQQLGALRNGAGSQSESAVHQLALAARQAREIDAWCRAHLGDHAPDLQALLGALDLFLSPQRPGVHQASPSDSGTATDPFEATQSFAVTHEGSPSFRPTGASPAASREDVLGVIRSARQWFEAHEPSSPAAVLLRQAELSVGKRFAQLVDVIPMDLLRTWEASAAEKETP